MAKKKGPADKGKAGAGATSKRVGWVERVVRITQIVRRARSAPTTKRRRSPMARAALLFGCAAAAVLLAGVISFLLAINRPLDFGEQAWRIEPGDSLGRVAAQLHERGVVTETLSLRLLARIDGVGHLVRSGEYHFPESVTLREFLRSVVKGTHQVSFPITILEGWTFREMRAHLRKAPRLEQTTSDMTDRELMVQLGHPDLHPEGRFFPDTYNYTAGDTDLSVFRQAFHLMHEKLDEAWQNRYNTLHIKSKEEVLILASIVQKESYLAEEQPQVAGVFYNRLKKKMRLQTDPTVIYGLGESFDGNLTRAHLRKDNPYNTYRRYGLTPTPISLPGWDSLDAVVRPAVTDAYYFVAISEGDGRHHFSKTLEEHNRAVNKYQRAKQK